MQAVSTELWVAALYGGILALVAIGQYLDKRKSATPPPSSVSSVVAGVGLGYLGHEMTDRLVLAAERVATATESIADRRQASIEEKLDALLDQLQQAEERSNTRRRRAADDTDATRVRRR